MIHSPTLRSDEERLSATFAALADPTRRAILARLAQGDISVLQLAAPFDMSLPAVTKHLNVLERAGLIARGRQAQRRPCRLMPEPLKDAASWVERYRQLWEQRLDRLEDFLLDLQAQAQASPTPGPEDPRVLHPHGDRAPPSMAPGLPASTSKTAAPKPRAKKRTP